ncbi:hypothetical protein DFJ74DRAFT_699358 [Hyaloraphidium curvatum]|nr:hypothetical protein DFJ74DRAFT_699358 [Hyaloraphidium curvatum]
MAAALPSVVAVNPASLSAALSSADHDALVVLYASLEGVASAAKTKSATSSALADVSSDLENVLAVNPGGAGIAPAAVIYSTAAPGKRIVLAPVGSLTADVDDARRYGDAAKAAFAKIRAIGASKPLLVCPDVPAGDKLYQHAAEVAVLGALQELYDPLQAREFAAAGGKFAPSPVKAVGFVTDRSDSDLNAVSKWIAATERGRYLSRDICMTDPIRGLPKKCVEIVKAHLSDVPSVKISVQEDPEVLAKEYPLLYAVARASLAAAGGAHAPAVVRLEYRSPDQSLVKENLFFVGKGIAFDTGGADIKVGGAMRGMSRDKGGAGVVAGILCSIGILQPKTINATAYLAFVRNSVGADMYTCDEIIQSRAGVRVHVGNTDAEGRMVLTDPLAALKEEALATVNPATARFFTVATLTGHVVRAYGGYPALVPVTAPAVPIAARISDTGLVLGDPWETSTIRREDYDFIAPTSSTEDVVQANSQPSTLTLRGHQYPAAFLAVASGLRNHGRSSEKPLAFVHCDVAGACEDKPKGGLSLGKANGGPVASFVATFLGQEVLPAGTANGINGTH